MFVDIVLSTCQMSPHGSGYKKTGYPPDCKIVMRNDFFDYIDSFDLNFL